MEQKSNRRKHLSTGQQIKNNENEIQVLIPEHLRSVLNDRCAKKLEFKCKKPKIHSTQKMFKDFKNQ